MGTAKMDVKLKIVGMHCSGCVNAVRRVLLGGPSVTDVSVDLENGHATVQTSVDIDPARLVAAVEDAGYEARVES